MDDRQSVFVVDDDKSARNGIAQLLRAAGYTVHAYSSAIKFLATLNPDTSGCLILDIRMPDMSGEELAVRLKNNRKNLSIIFVTAEDDPKIKKRAMDMGADGYFRKPVDGTALIDAIIWTFNKTNDNNSSMS